MSERGDRWPAGDDAFLDDLRRVLAAADPVPDMVAEHARAAFSMRALDAELAELLADSAAEAAPTGLRSTGTVRMLTFATAGGEVEVEVQVESRNDRRDIVGQLLGAASGFLRIETPAGTTEVPLDESGLFAARGVSDGLVRLRCTSASGQSVATSWVQL